MCVCVCVCVCINSKMLFVCQEGQINFYYPRRSLHIVGLVLFWMEVGPVLRIITKPPTIILLKVILNVT